MFKYNIYLKICKRVGEKDRLILDELYDDFWIKQLPIREIIKKYFRFTKEINKTDMNIAYTNDRCKYVSNEVRKQLGYTGSYVVGEELICRLYLKQDGAKFNANIRYKILYINGSKITIENIKDKKKHTLDEETLYKHFRYGYCATCHSCQGASIKNNITIHEWQHPRFSREFLWTALTRATDFKHVSFFQNRETEFEFREQKLHSYLRNKIQGYKQQDMKANRELNLDNYIDMEWCLDRLNGTCGKCGCGFWFETKKGLVNSNFTCQRVENSFSHSKDNCIAYCDYCNCSSK